MNELRPIVSGMPERHLIVVGDLLLDEFIFGEITRVSREAPVLILRYKERDWRPGGAANTIAGAAALGCKVSAIGAIGDDEWGHTLLSSWPENVDRENVLVSDRLKTTCKSRVLGGAFHSLRQQVVRIDYEHPHELSHANQLKLIAAIGDQISCADAVIVSDYSLGTVTDLIATETLKMAQERHLPVFVDSRFTPQRFRGATCMTPNISEVEAAVGMPLRDSLETLHKTGHELLNAWELDCLVITQGKLGMLVFEPDRMTEIPAFGNDEVADVTGAGDTVTATLAASVAAGSNFVQAAQLANIAAGIVVTKKGTSRVMAQELLNAVENFYP